MSIRFRGGDRIQKGKGIGGILRAVVSLFKPMAQTIGKTAVNAVRSKTGKMVLDAVKDQALSSVVNLTADALRGNDLKESFRNEVATTKQSMGDTFEDIVTTGKKRVAPPLNRASKKLKRSQLKLAVKKGKPSQGYNSYTDDRVKDMLV